MASYRKIPEDPGKPNGKAKAWEVEMTLGWTPKGRRMRRSRTFRTREKAEAWVKEEEAKMTTVAGVVEPSKESLAEYLERWLEGIARHQVRPRTFAGYAGTLRRYVIDPPEGAFMIGAIRMDRLTSAAFQEHYRWMKDERGLSSTSVRIHHAVLRLALNHAVRTGLLGVNPVAQKRVILPRPERPEITPLNEEEAGRFLDAAREDRYFALWTLLLTGGLRPGEALGLMWEDFDPEENRIRIRRTLTRTGVKGWKLEPPKTERSRRTVVLPGFAVEALSEHRRKQAEERLKAGPKYARHDSGFIFATPLGEPLEQRNATQRHFLKVLKAAGLGTRAGTRKNAKWKPRFRMYDLRHTCATMLLLVGESPKVVQERLGHASVTLTLDTYSHVLPTMQERSAEKLESILAPGNRASGTGG